MKAKYRGIDKQLYRWLLEQRESGHRVSGKCLKREALRLHSESGYVRNRYVHVSDALLLGHAQLIEYLWYVCFSMNTNT